MPETPRGWWTGGGLHPGAGPWYSAHVWACADDAGVGADVGAWSNRSGAAASSRFSPSSTCWPTPVSQRHQRKTLALTAIRPATVYRARTRLILPRDARRPAEVPDCSRVTARVVFTAARGKIRRARRRGPAGQNLPSWSPVSAAVDTENGVYCHRPVRPPRSRRTNPAPARLKPGALKAVRIEHTAVPPARVEAARAEDQAYQSSAGSRQ